MSDKNLNIPLLPLRDVVIFPSVVTPLFVGREKSITALQAAMAGDKQIMLVAQKSAQQDDPKLGDLYTIGTLSTILQLIKLPDGTLKVLVEGNKRASIESIESTDEFMSVKVNVIQEEPETEGLKHFLPSLKKQFQEYVKLTRKATPEVLNTVNAIDSLSRLTDTLVGHLSIDIGQKQEILEMTSLAERAKRILEHLDSQLDLSKVEKKIRGRVKSQMEKSQKEYYLNEQMKALKKELGEIDETEDADQLEAKINEAGMTKEAQEKALSELQKYKMMSPMSAEASVVRGYIDWMLNIPWKKKSKIRADLNKASDVLNEDHFGLEEVKERILEYLAVQKRDKKLKGPVLCLVGPPGVGKTSLGKSIAKATNREFVRMSVGGMRDEAEIRGHRRTYIGSLPGKIIQMMKKAGTKNPLILLDEIDKIGNDYRGDPSSALLEALDPEQNTTFNDHYLEVDYDLSDVMFVTTANTLNILPPLLDRMEVIRLAGYTEDEKINIANKYLLPKQIKDNGVKDKEMKLEDDIIKEVIRGYTKESGVRNLEREISKLARKVVKKIVAGEEKEVNINNKNLSDFLGIAKFKFGELEAENRVGVVTGLAWTEYGGEILKIETVTMPGKGRMQITGKLGDVMQESVKAAKSFVRSKCLEYGIIPPLFEKKDFHIHVPEGATPKDGPSAGIGMVTSIVSSITGIPVRRDVAMTGEVTLTGQVLPIGGLKEKLLAAHRAGIKEVLIPKENEKDLVDMPKKIIDDIKITPVEFADQVLKVALTKELKRTEWVEVDISKKDDKSQASIQ